MKAVTIERLKRELATPHDESQTWLENQYPATPSKRYSPSTYLNYQNIEELYGKEAASQLASFMEANPSEAIVVLAPLTKTGRVSKRPRLFRDPESHYYGLYELFACAAHMDGFIEVFHNFKRKAESPC